jgi:hypothetical protein
MKWLNIIVPFAMAIFAAYVDVTANIFFPEDSANDPAASRFRRGLGDFGSLVLCSLLLLEHYKLFA